MVTVGVVTVGRSDYSVYLPLLRRIEADTELRLHLMVSGMHLSAEFGLTVGVIEEDGFTVGERVEMLLPSDTPGGIARSMGAGTIGFADAFERVRPDILVVLGDRFEMHAATVAAVPFLIPVAHIAGGALTLGAIDDSLRHSITKMSSLHFAETEEYARRVVQMGEEPWRVIVTGALALENLRQMDLLSFEELRRRYGLKSEEPPLLVTFHPVTRQHAQTKHHVTELLAALAGFDLPVVFTYPNADTSGRQIIPMIDEFVSRNRQSQAIANLGTLGYFSLMKHSVAMVGNSSSGIVEAPSFKLPVVNIGDRQKGRTAAANVISVGHHREDIRAGTREAISPQFNDRLTDLVNPYEGDRPSEAIVNTLKSVPIDGALLEKEFYDQRILAAVP